MEARSINTRYSGRREEERKYSWGKPARAIVVRTERSISSCVEGETMRLRNRRMFCKSSGALTIGNRATTFFHRKPGCEGRPWRSKYAPAPRRPQYKSVYKISKTAGASRVRRRQSVASVTDCVSVGAEVGRGCFGVGWGVGLFLVVEVGVSDGVGGGNGVFLL